MREITVWKQTLSGKKARKNGNKNKNKITEEGVGGEDKLNKGAELSLTATQQ